MVEFQDHSVVKLIKTNAADDDVLHAAWVSNFGSEAVEKDVSNERRIGLINFLLREKHMSPFEHGSFTFFIETPIFVIREFHRHRTMSYNETSGRYKVLEPKFYLPKRERPLVQAGKMGDYHFVAGTDEQYNIVVEDQTAVCEFSWERYNHQLDAGIAKEVARNILPFSIFSQFYATVNPRNLMQFLSLRNEEHALAEIQEVAKDMEVILEEAMPITHKAFRS